MRTILIFAACLAGALLPGCGSDAPDEGVSVVATTGILADITAAVAGPDVEVDQLIPDGSSPHDFALSADDRLRLEQADLIVANGAGLEATLPLDELDTPRWELAENVGSLLPPDDPHVWMDPLRVASALPSLAGALAEADSPRADAFRSGARKYAQELRRLDSRIARTLQAVPPANRDLVTSHDSLEYFADRYGLEVVATAFPTTGPESEASAAAVEEVVDAVRAHDVPAVFAGEEDDPEALELVGDETGADVVDDLIIESLGSAASYADMLAADAEVIATALRGS
jgi:zinc/manganese transport system substrate-binding protein